MGARLRIFGQEGQFSKLSQGGYVITRHLRPLIPSAPDAAGIAEMFLHAPYLWGGCTVAGIDCSGLVQMALRMAGHEGVPRDSGDQEKQTGAPLPLELATRGGCLRRGDLVFWKGHVAMMLDEERIIHANGHHMRVAIEPLRAAMERIKASGGGPVRSLRRP
jgi:cell wall-associated NlpC family hydrolase